MNETEQLLEQLRDVEAPQVAFSIALGWWILLLLAILLVGLAVLAMRRRRARLWQRQAKQAMQSIREQAPNASCENSLASCSQLARKVVLAVDDRTQVASLHGEAWLEKLDDVCKRPEFTQGIGRVLLDHAYQKQPNIAQRDLTALFDSMDVLIDSAGSYTHTSTQHASMQSKGTANDA